MRDKTFYIVCIGFLLGTACRSFVFLDEYFISFLFLLAFSIYIIHRKVLIPIFLISLAFGVLRFHLSDKSPSLNFEEKVGLEQTYTGQIVLEPDIRANNQKITVLITEEKENSLLTQDKGSLVTEKTKVLVTVSLEESLQSGEEIILRGKLQKPENFSFSEESERYFDYISYLKKDGIFFTMSYPFIQVKSQSKGNPIKSKLFFLKEKFLKVINASMPREESILLGGLILGEKSSFSEETRKDLINTGTIHIVALSGYNVTIVAEWIIKIFKKIFFFFPQTVSLYAGILGIILFVVISGGQSTAVRAGIMAVLALIARATGRTYDAGRGLILAGVFMVLVNPFVLIFDVSFELSFMATFAVIFIVPKFLKYFKWIKWKWLEDIVCTTTVVYIFVLPFILYKMGNLSLLAIPTNIFVLPLIPLTMGLGFLTGFLGIFSFYFSSILGRISFFLLHSELSVIGFFAKIPLSVFIVPTFSPIFVLVFYSLTVYFFLRGFFTTSHF